LTGSIKYYSTGSGGEIDERQSTLLIVATAQMNWHFGRNHFQRRPDSALKEIASVRGPIWLADDHVRMQSWLAVLLHNVAAKRKDLNLFVDGIVL
jgi:hypothetical protein